MTTKQGNMIAAMKISSPVRDEETQFRDLGFRPIAIAIISQSNFIRVASQVQLLPARHQQEDQRGNGRRQTEVLTAAALRDTVGADEQTVQTRWRGGAVRRSGSAVINN